MDVYLKRLRDRGDLDRFQVFNYTASATLPETQTGSVCTNYGASGTITLTLPVRAIAGTRFKFMVGAAKALRIKVSAAGEKFIVGGATSIDDGGGDLYLWADDEGESANFVCISSKVWLIDKIGTWTIVQP